MSFSYSINENHRILPPAPNRVTSLEEARCNEAEAKGYESLKSFQAELRETLDYFQRSDNRQYKEGDVAPANQEQYERELREYWKRRNAYLRRSPLGRLFHRPPAEPEKPPLLPRCANDMAPDRGRVVLNELDGKTRSAEGEFAYDPVLYKPRSPSDVAIAGVRQAKIRTTRKCNYPCRYREFEVSPTTSGRQQFTLTTHFRDWVDDRPPGENGLWTWTETTRWTVDRSNATVHFEPTLESEHILDETEE